jgi:hypothetical protein
MLAALIPRRRDRGARASGVAQLSAAPRQHHERAIFAGTPDVMGTPRYGLPPREADFEDERASADSYAPEDTDAHAVVPSHRTEKRQVSAVQARVIDAMYDSLRTLDDREVLSVRAGADPLEIRCAYESLLAAFHPRRFAGTALGSSHAKLEAILQRIDAAYFAMSTPEDRAAHDARFGKPDR